MRARRPDTGLEARGRRIPLASLRLKLNRGFMEVTAQFSRSPWKVSSRCSAWAILAGSSKTACAAAEVTVRSTAIATEGIALILRRFGWRWMAICFRQAAAGPICQAAVLASSPTLTRAIQWR
jgi:hypothetical protein